MDNIISSSESSVNLNPDEAVIKLETQPSVECIGDEAERIVPTKSAEEIGKLAEITQSNLLLLISPIKYTIT